MNTILRKYGMLIAVSGGILVIDQVTKILVRTQLKFGEVWDIWPQLDGKFQILHWKNSGMFMGVFKGYGAVFTVLAFVVAIAVIFFFPRVPKEDWGLRLGMALQLGGVLGNLADRLSVGYVTDFVSIGQLPVFNLADLCIYLGLAILLVSLLSRPSSKKPHPETTREGPQT